MKTRQAYKTKIFCGFAEQVEVELSAWLTAHDWDLAHLEHPGMALEAWLLDATFAFMTFSDNRRTIEIGPPQVTVTNGQLIVTLVVVAHVFEVVPVGIFAMEDGCP